jgi:hypothetical protein
VDEDGFNKAMILPSTIKKYGYKDKQLDSNSSRLFILPQRRQRLLVLQAQNVRYALQDIFDN